MQKVVRIGGASAMLLDSVAAVEQLLHVEELDYLVFDFLGEGSMGHLSMMSKAIPGGGFAREFVDVHVMPHLATLLARGFTDLFDGRAFPQAIESMNAYLGAFPIAEALARGADIVIVGRSVDSAVTLGPLIHEFGWNPDQHDLLAAGTLVGHLIECGTQVTGGTYTDWRVVPDWANGGFPVAECHADGSAVITKPAGTGGLVSTGTVSEQMLYEVADPQAYFVPDVTCDFSAVRVTQQGPDRVHVSGARGYPPTPTYKVCATWHRGWRATVMQPIVAIDAVPRAQRQAAAQFKRFERLLEQRGLGPCLGTHLDVIGSEGTLGARARNLRSREVVCRMVVEHPERARRNCSGARVSPR